MGEQEQKHDDDQQVFEEFQKMICDAKLDQNFGESWAEFHYSNTTTFVFNAAVLELGFLLVIHPLFVFIANTSTT